METHYYQPGFLFIPFGMYSKNDVIKPKRDFIPAGVDVIKAAADVIEPDKNQVKLVDGKILHYDVLGGGHGHRHPPGGDRRPGRVPSGAAPSLTFTAIEGAQALAKQLRRGRGAGWC